MAVNLWKSFLQENIFHKWKPQHIISPKNKFTYPTVSPFSHHLPMARFFFRRNTMQRQTENISYFEIKINCHCYWSYSNMYLWTWHYQIKILSGLLYKKMKYKCLVQNNINISFKKMKSGSRQFLFLQFKIDL